MSDKKESIFKRSDKYQRERWIKWDKYRRLHGSTTLTLDKEDRCQYYIDKWMSDRMSFGVKTLIIRLKKSDAPVESDPVIMFRGET
jgi:hypothetical protein